MQSRNKREGWYSGTDPTGHKRSVLPRFQLRYRLIYREKLSWD